MSWQPRALARAERSQVQLPQKGKVDSSGRSQKVWGCGLRRNQEVKWVSVKQNVQARAQETGSARRTERRATC